MQGRYIISTVLLWLYSSVAVACPICDTETGDAVRAGIQTNFGLNLVAAVSPFAVILVVILALTGGLGTFRRKP